MTRRRRNLVILAVVLCGLALYVLPLVLRLAGVAQAWGRMGREHNARMLRIDTLPELHAVIVSGTAVRAPFSREEVVVCAIIQGLADKHETWHKTRSHATYIFRRDMVVLAASDLVVDIGGEQFTGLPDSAVIAFAEGWSRYQAEKDGSLGSRYESFHHRWPFDAEDSAYLNATRALQGRSRTIDLFNAQDPERPERDICLEELLYRVGDTVRFKGRLEEGRIVPLF